MLLVLVALADAASAQVTASLSAVSDFRIRGLTLNGARPAASASLSYDHPSGVYLGASATGGDTRRFGGRFLNHTEYLGYAARLNAQLSWDAGVSNTQVFSNVFNRFSGNYVEVYAGVSSERLGLRVYYSPSFIASGLGSVYIDFNATLRPAQRLRIFGHGGLLIPVHGDGSAVLPKARYDTRFGIAAEMKRSEIQLSWIRSGAEASFLVPRRQPRDALVLGASYFF